MPGTITPAAVTAPPEASSTRTLAALCLAVLLSSLGTSIANVALPNLAAAFEASFAQVQWVVLAYLLGSTTLIVSVGRLGDMFGRRRLLLIGIALFTIASASSGAAATLGQLIAARAVQGVGAAIMLTSAMAFVGEAVPRDKIGRAMGLLGSTSAAGTALGPSLGGLLLSSFGWQAIFLINLPLGIVAFVLARRQLPADRLREGGRRRSFDVPGTFLLSATLGAYALAVTTGRGTFGIVNVALLLTAAVGTLSFIAVQRRSTSPLIDLPTLRAAGLRAGLTMSLIVSTVMMTTLVVGPFYLSQTLRLEPMFVGVIMSAGPIVAALAGAPAGRAVDHFGTRPTTLVGLAGIATGCGFLAILPTELGTFGYIGAITTMTAAYALFQAANNSAVMAATSPDCRGGVSGILNLSRNVGLMTGASVMGAVFASAVGAYDGAATSPEAVAYGLRITFGTAAAFIFITLAGLTVSIFRPNSSET